VAAPENLLRRTRERELVLATRALFDERGMQDAPVEEIARAAGIARGLIYRHFSSKEELYVLTVTDYLDELHAAQVAAIDPDADAVTQLRDATVAYASFCRRYPAFLDCALALMHRPAVELHDMVSESVWLRLGQGMAKCLDRLIGVLTLGHESGVMHVPDPAYTANVQWTQTLGIMHLARIGVGVHQLAPSVPGLFSVGAERVIATCVELALAGAGATAVPDPQSSSSSSA
jgi:AcrR family transcriptional regulator